MMTNSISNRLGKYEIIGEIGRGGFAAVYEAVDTTLDRTVALKALAPHLLWDPSFLERFQQEAKLAASLKHPNIVVIYEFGKLEGVVYITMEYLSDQNLAGLVREEGALAPSRILKIVSQVASALDYAHSKGLVHRDIKPSNIMIGAGDHVTVTDFGIAKAAAATALTTTGKIFGTPEYMSPEQAMGKRELDARSDNYSLGVVVYRMFTGQVPFSGETPLGVMRCHADEPPPPPSQINPAISPAVEAILLKALAKEREKRYQEAGDIVLALEEAFREEAEDKEQAEARAMEERAKAEAEREKQEKLSILYAEAGKAYETGRWQETVDAFEQVLALDAEYRDVATRLAVARRKLAEKTRLEETPRAETRARLLAYAKHYSPRGIAILLVVCISLVVLHLTLVRPIVEDVVYSAIQPTLRSLVVVEPYTSGKQCFDVTEQKVNETLAAMVQDVLTSRKLEVQLRQDSILASGEVSGYSVWIKAEPAVNTAGDFQLRRLRINWLLQLMLSPEGLRKFIEEYVNESVLSPGRVELLELELQEDSMTICIDTR
jgi:tetratricopeptide (TPR) repeat protein